MPGSSSTSFASILDLSLYDEWRVNDWMSILKVDGGYLYTHYGNGRVVGTQYVTDGESSETIQSDVAELKAQQSDNTVTVKTADQLFNTTLDPTKIYIIDNPNIQQPAGESILMPEGGLNLRGYSLRASKLISAEDGTPMFIVDPAGSYSGAMNFSNFTIQGSGTNSVIFDLDNDGQTDNENNNIDWLNVTFVTCSSLGNIDNYRQGFWDVASTIFCGGLTLGGTWSGGWRTSAARILHSDSSAVFQAGVGLTMGGRFVTDAFYTGFGSHGGYSDFAPANIDQDGDFQIIGGKFEVSGSPVNDITTFFPNMPLSSTKAFFSSIGFEKTRIGGSIVWTVAASTPIPAPGTWVKLNGTTVLNDAQWTSATGSNRMNYISNQPTSGRVQGNISINGGTSDDVGVRLRHYIAATGTTETIAQFRGEIPLFGSITAPLLGFAEFNNGDYLELEGTSFTDTTAIEAEIDSIYNLSTS